MELFLSRIDLSGHSSTMLSNRLMLVDDLSDLKRSDLVGIGIPLGDANRILKSAREIQNGGATSSQLPAYADSRGCARCANPKIAKPNPPTPPENDTDTIAVVTSDKCEFLLSKSLARKSSGYFRALFDTDCQEIKTGVVKVQLLGADFQRVHDLMVYPASAIGDVIGKDLPRTDASKLLYNAKYFQLREWIPIILRNTNECCSDITSCVISDCSICEKQHLCTEQCNHCKNTVCRNCMNWCNKCHMNTCSLPCSECCADISPVRDWGKYDTNFGQRMTLQGHVGVVLSVAFSDDGKLLASASSDKNVHIWDNVAGVRVRTLEGHTSCVTSICFSKNGKFVASGSRDFTVRLWDPTTGKQLRSLEGHTCAVRGVCFNSKNLVASASSDKTVRVWDAETGHQIRSLSVSTTYVFCVKFSNDDKYLISGSRDKIRIWDAETGNHLRALEGHTSQVNSITVSPDSKYVASGSHDKQVKVWELESGLRLASLTGHSSWVNTVCYSNDGRYLASCSGDKTIRIWEAATGKYVWSLEGHSTGVLAVSFSNDGRYLASCSADTVRVYSSQEEPLHTSS
eukprot:TRINITY_DN33969_c0_g1_i1.p1 TRINITY_DN33969_c0_g1~~TRINITY_DN33969_c0_g1_i1.p1  ORF type:complete len:571 (+),score=60.74 TRINITY_DN33969_c0_g1_i1:43-1755(+)